MHAPKPSSHSGRIVGKREVDIPPGRVVVQLPGGPLYVQVERDTVHFLSKFIDPVAALRPRNSGSMGRQIVTDNLAIFHHEAHALEFGDVGDGVAGNRN